MSAPIVSVLTTVYNRQDFLAETIESVLVSTIQDFEYIIVDDQSTDESYEVAKAYAAKDSRIQVHRNPTNLGDYPNRNKAASYATGKYLKYVDSDDLIYPHGLAIMVDAMERFPDAALGLSAPAHLPHPFQLSPEQAYERHFLGIGLFSVGPLGAIIHRKRFKSIGYFSGSRYVGDIEGFLKLGAIHPTVVIQRDICYWRVHQGQEYVRGIQTGAYLEQAFELERIAIRSNQCPLPSAIRAQYMQAIDKRHATALLVGARHGQVSAIWDAIMRRKIGLSSLSKALISILFKRS